MTSCNESTQAVVYAMAFAMRSRLLRPLYTRAASSTSGADSGINILSGAPEKHLVRAVRIFRPAK